MKEFCVVANKSVGFVACKAMENYDKQMGYVVAEYDTLEDAEAGIVRAQALEKLLRPAWQAAIEHETRLRNMMLDAVYKAAQPL